MSSVQLSLRAVSKALRAELKCWHQRASAFECQVPSFIQEFRRKVRLYHKQLAQRNVYADWASAKTRIRLVRPESQSGPESDMVLELLQATNQELTSRHQFLVEILTPDLTRLLKVQAPDLVYTEDEWLEGSAEAKLRAEIIRDRVLGISR